MYLFEAVLFLTPTKVR